MNIQDYLIEQDTVLAYIQQHKLSQWNNIWIYFAFGVLLLIAVSILTSVVGGILFFLNVSESWFSHWILSYLASVYIILTLGIYLWTECYQYRQYQLKRAILPFGLDTKEMLNDSHYSTFQQYQVNDINQKIAEFFQVSPLPIYIIRSEEINIASYQRYHQASIIITWQAVYQLHRPELMVLLYTQYLMILLGQTQQRSLVYHLLFAFNCGVASAFRVKQNHQETYFNGILHKIYQKITLFLCSADYILQAKFKRFLYRTICLENDIIYVKSLKKPILYVLLLQQCQHSMHHQNVHRYGFVQLDILSLCADNYLYRWLYKMSIYPNLAQRLSLLSKYHHAFDPMLNTAYSSQYNGVLYYLQLMQGKSLSQVYQQYELFNISSLNYHVPDESQHAHLNRDAIRPLNPNLRREQAITHYFSKIFSTQAHYLHSISLILMLRKNPQLNMNDLDISATVCMALKSIDERLYIQIFQQCLNYINLPKMIAQEQLKQWFAMIHYNHSMSIIDALLFEQLKYRCSPYIVQHHYHPLDVIDDVLALIQGLTFIQPYQQLSTAHKFNIFQKFYSYYDLEVQGIDEKIFDEKIERVNYHQVLSRLFGLSVQYRLFLLYLIEQLLLEHDSLTQEGFDVLLLLYWRFGFATEDFAMQLYARNQNILFAIDA